MLWASSLSLEEEEKVRSSSFIPSTPAGKSLLSSAFLPLPFNSHHFCVSYTCFSNNTLLFHLLWNFNMGILGAFYIFYRDMPMYMSHF